MNAKKRAEEFLAISGQFKLGSLVTESPHPVTANLSDVARESIPDALRLLFEVDRDVLRKYREWISTGAPARIAGTVFRALKQGGRIFFTGCGSTGRLSILLDSIWRGFWQDYASSWTDRAGDCSEWADRTCSVMAGGDFALIKSVEGFEDFTAFGARQIEDMGVGPNDVVFAITEGGETSFVIGTAWKALEKGAKVYFVYNNPDEILRATVERSREVIDKPRIEKINLTTGPMAITGSTRMQATTIQLCVMLTVLEMVVRDVWRARFARGAKLKSITAPNEFLAGLEDAHASLCSDETVNDLARLVELEESVYRSGGRVNYFADLLAIDVLTDTTERSPTFCTPPFRKFDDANASESWAFLFTPQDDTPTAWERLLKRKPRAVTWTKDEIKKMVGAERAPRLAEIVRSISLDEIHKFRIGLDGLPDREPRRGDGVTAVASTWDLSRMLNTQGFASEQLARASDAGAGTATIVSTFEIVLKAAKPLLPGDHTVCLKTPDQPLLLDGVTRVAVKMLLNALSTCTMVRLGRVMGNYMIYVVPSNLKLIDRATRYISRLTGLSYEDACYLLFEVIEYVEPRMKSDRAYPPVVGLSVTRAKHGFSNEEAEAHLIGHSP